MTDNYVGILEKFCLQQGSNLGMPAIWASVMNSFISIDFFILSIYPLIAGYIAEVPKYVLNFSLGNC